MSRVIEARGLLRRYRAAGSPIRAVDGVDVVVEAGETVSVMGPSGCGKSTLLHLLGGLERPDGLWRPGRAHRGGRGGWGGWPRALACRCRACWGSGRRGGGLAGCSPTPPRCCSGWR